MDQCGLRLVHGGLVPGIELSRIVQRLCQPRGRVVLERERGHCFQVGDLNAGIAFRSATVAEISVSLSDGVTFSSIGPLLAETTFALPSTSITQELPETSLTA